MQPEVQRVLGNLQRLTGIEGEVVAAMATMTDLMAKIAEAQADLVETLKDVQRLIAQGDTQPAIDALQQVIDTNTQTDAAVEAVSPEPTTTTAAATDAPAADAADGGFVAPES